MENFKEGDVVFTLDGMEALYVTKTSDGKHIIEITYIQHEDYVSMECGGAGFGCEMNVDWKKSYISVDHVFKELPVNHHNKEITSLISKEDDLKKSISDLKREELFLKNSIQRLNGNYSSEKNRLDRLIEEVKERDRQLKNLESDVKKFVQLFYKYASFGEISFKGHKDKIPSHFIEGAIKNMDLMAIVVNGKELKLTPLGLSKNLPKKEDYYKKSVLSLFAGGYVTILEAKSQFLFLSEEDDLYSVEVFLQKRNLDDDEFIVYPCYKGDSEITKQTI